MSLLYIHYYFFIHILGRVRMSVLYYVADVILTEFNLSLHKITSVFQSAVIFMICRIMEFKVCIFWMHFLIDTYLIEQNRHFLSTYFLLILSNWRIDLMVFGRNWWLKLP